MPLGADVRIDECTHFTYGLREAAIDRHEPTVLSRDNPSLARDTQSDSQAFRQTVGGFARLCFLCGLLLLVWTDVCDVAGVTVNGGWWGGGHGSWLHEWTLHAICLV